MLSGAVKQHHGQKRTVSERLQSASPARKLLLSSHTKCRAMETHVQCSAIIDRRLLEDGAALDSLREKEHAECQAWKEHVVQRCFGGMKSLRLTIE